jgi:hypothetical protein
MAIMTNYHFNAITGGVNSLDSVDGNRLRNGDRGYTIVAGVFKVYYLDATSGAADNGTTIIAPDLNPGTKRWIRCT